MLRIGIYGGAFAPIHKGHVEAAKAFMRQMWLDVLFIVPTGESPHKDMDRSASDNDRLEMCRLAFRGVEGVIVSDTEIKRGGKSYSIDTVREFARDDSRLFMLCGTDMILTLDAWDGADEIFKLCYPVYMRRENDGAKDAEIIEKIADYRKRFGKTVMKIVADPIEISSTVVRSKIARGEDVSSLIPQAVEDYVRENGLYLSED